MNVLHVDTARSWRGGERQVLALARGMAEYGHRTAVVCPPGSALERRARGGVCMFGVRMRGEWDVAAAWELRRIIARFRPHVLHLHTAHAHTLGVLAASGFINRPKVIVSRRVDFRVARNPLSRMKYRYGIDRIIAVSEGVERVLRKDGVDAGKVTVIRSGVDLRGGIRGGSREVLFGDLGIPWGARIVGNVAALAPHKDHSCLLRAARRVVDRIPIVRFLIVGEGELERDLKRLTERLGLEKEVIFTGFREDVVDILSMLDVFVLSSHLEGLGTSVLDAMAIGIPVVATRTGGIPEMVNDGVNGFLVPVGNPSKLADRICQVLLDDPLRERLGRNARCTAEHFDIRETIRRTEELYRAVVGER